MEKTASTVIIERSAYESLSRENAELKVLVEYYKRQLLLSKRGSLARQVRSWRVKAGKRIDAN